jgi:putative membrane protein
MKRRIFKTIKTNPYMQAIRHPEIYLKRMLTHTFLVGLVTFIINWIYVNTAMHSVKIPTGIHAMLGFVIAMLLVFRTNTAYERWWEGRKKIQELKYNYISIIAIIEGATHMSSLQKEYFYKEFDKQLEYIRSFLKSEDHILVSSQIRQMTVMLRMVNNNKTHLQPEEVSDLRKYLQETSSMIVACERIKYTPIPIAFAIHVKLCIFIYVATLPFSLFHDLNLWSTPIVMALYFIISGTEIISNEIENPFQGEANDLPVDELLDEIKDLIPVNK